MSLNNKKNLNSDHSMADVLYQKLGSDWYAFTEVDGECYVSKVAETTIESKKEEQEEFFIDALLKAENALKKNSAA